MNDDISIDDLLGSPDPAPKADTPKADAKPKVDPKPPTPREPVQVDTAIEVRAVDWRCECDNTNTHSLTRCGKCNKPRYITE